MQVDFTKEIERYLPPYLLPKDKEELFSEIRGFPGNLEYYHPTKLNGMLQGDACPEISLVDISIKELIQVKGLIISNSCNLDPSNESSSHKKITLCPIINLNRYLGKFSDTKKRDSVENAIKSQEITNIFYLPPLSSILEDSIILFDDIHSVPQDNYNIEKKSKLFNLNQFGFYIFVIKLSIHFTRIQEGLSRT